MRLSEKSNHLSETSGYVNERWYNFSGNEIIYQRRKRGKDEMKQRVWILLMTGILILGLTACSKETPTLDTVAPTDMASVENNTEEDSQESDTEEASTELEIVDGLPEGPAGLDFGTDNIGFYMEGESFTLPMAYSEFVTKAAGLGWSVNEDTIHVRSSDENREEGDPGRYAYTKIEFERPVENQELPEYFEIKVINSVDPMQDADLASSDAQVISFDMYMSATREGYGEEATYRTYNINSQLWLTKEVGMGRDIRNAVAVWGDPVNKAEENFSPYYWEYEYTSDGEAVRKVSVDGYGECPLGSYIRLGQARYTTGLNAESDNDTYYALFDGEKKAEQIIDHIMVVNNPYIE